VVDKQIANIKKLVSGQKSKKKKKSKSGYLAPKSNLSSNYSSKKFVPPTYRFNQYNKKPFQNSPSFQKIEKFTSEKKGFDFSIKLELDI
jgi:hypothetical protein